MLSTAKSIIVKMLRINCPYLPFLLTFCRLDFIYLTNYSSYYCFNLFNCANNCERLFAIVLLCRNYHFFSIKFQCSIYCSNPIGVFDSELQ